jgi:hypothetical protein
MLYYIGETMDIFKEIEKQSAECTQYLQRQQESVKESIADVLPDVPQSNIYEIFGDSLMKTIGNPNGQNKTTLLDIPDVGPGAKLAFVTGKRFGVRKIDPYYDKYTRKKRNTAYFSRNNLFHYLQQAHVEGVNREVQKQILSDWIAFRDQCVKLHTITNQDIYNTSVEIPVKLLYTKNIQVNTSSGYSYDQYSVIDRTTTKNAIITNVILVMGGHKIAFTPTEMYHNLYHSMIRMEQCHMVLVGKVENTETPDDLVNICDILFTGNKVSPAHPNPRIEFTKGMRGENIEYKLIEGINNVFQHEKVKSKMTIVNNAIRMMHKAMKHVQLKHANRILINGLF